MSVVSDISKILIKNNLHKGAFSYKKPICARVAYPFVLLSKIQIRGFGICPCTFLRPGVVAAVVVHLATQEAGKVVNGIVDCFDVLLGCK